MCGCQNIKLKYVGEDLMYWAPDQVYQAFGLVGTGQPILFSDIDNKFHNINIYADWELVSVAIPGDDIQLYP
jgi:hypothetical protein